MSSLRSALDEIRMQDLRVLSDEELEEHVVEFARAADVFAAERARAIAEVDRRNLRTRDGYVSTTAWLADKARLSFSAAKREVTTATALTQMPATMDTLAEGEISASAVDVMATACEADPVAFATAETSLLELARGTSIGELSARTAEWIREVDGASGERERRLFERRKFSMALTPDGSWRVRGMLDPETGQTVSTAIRSLVDAEIRDGFDLRTPEQRNADAVAEICRQHLDRSDRPVVNGERPHLTVTVDVDRLAQQPDLGASELTRRIACDASVTRVVTKGRAEPLEVGRRTPVVSAAIRRALSVRDGGCAFPMCDRPPSWTDAHHVVHWTDGGETKLANLVLLCRPHHRMIHDGFRVRMNAGRAAFSRPDGTAIEDRAPP